jgi:hypothetical protein
VRSKKENLGVYMKFMILCSLLLASQAYATGEMIQVIRTVELPSAVTSDDPQIQVNMDNIARAKKEAVKEVKLRCPGIQRVEVNSQTIYAGQEGRHVSEMIFATGLCI